MLGASDYDYLISIGVLTEITRNLLSDEEKHLAFLDKNVRVIAQ